MAAAPKWKGTWKASVQHLEFYYNFLDNENLHIKTIAFTMPCKYTFNEEVEPHTLDIHTKDPSGTSRKLLGYIQFEEEDDTLILWTPRAPPTSEIDPERPSIDDCDKMVCKRSKLPETDENIKKLSKRERVLAVLKETATLLNGYKRDGMLTSEDLQVQQKVGLSLMAIPSKYGISPQEVEDISSADPELKAVATKLQTDLVEDLQPTTEQLNIFEEPPEQPKQEKPTDRKVAESDKKPNSSVSPAATSAVNAAPQPELELKAKAAEAEDDEEEADPAPPKKKAKAVKGNSQKSSRRKSSGKKGSKGSKGDARQTTIIRGTYKEEEDQTGNTWLKVAGGAVVVGAVAFVALKLRNTFSRS